MFDDSLIESTGRIRTRTKWYAIASLALQATLLAIFILIPYIYPAALPKQALHLLLTIPPAPPVSPAMSLHAMAARNSQTVLIDSRLTAPATIPTQIAASGHNEPGPAPVGDIFGQTTGDGMIGSLPSTIVAAPSPHVVPRKPPERVRISAGVMAGQLLAPIHPVYPSIALAARMQGTVVVAATISKQGLIVNLHVVSGPPLLQQAAVTAISQARYKPYTLSGEPVEVETTINVIFTLGN
jgi:protein TonB